jgi:hypothetical protein
MKTLVTLVAVLVFPVVVAAAPLDPKAVDADAKWLVHLDMEAMLDSSVVDKALDKWMEKEDGERHLDRVKEELGVDLRKDVKSVTLYNTGYAEHEAVAVVKATFDKSKLEAKAQQAPDHKVEKVGDVELHTWTDKQHGNRTVAGAFVGDDAMVLGSSVDLTKQAIAVLQGDEDSLAGASSSLAGKAADGAILVGRVVGLATADLPKKSELPKGVDEIAVAIGEHEGKSFLVGRVGTTSEESAKLVKDAIEGLRSMALLAHSQDEEAKTYLQGATIEQGGNAVEVEMRVSADDVWETLQKAEARKHGR